MNQERRAQPGGVGLAGRSLPSGPMLHHDDTGSPDHGKTSCAVAGQGGGDPTPRRRCEPVLRATGLGLLGLLLVATACSYRPPPTRGQVVTLADNLLLHHEWDWGPVVQIHEPGPADAEGRRWWQVDYRGPAEWSKSPRPLLAAVLVDCDNGWARFLPASYVPLVTTAKVPAPTVGRIVPGSWMLVIEQWPNQAAAGPQAQALADRLNEWAREDHIAPLFSVRSTRRGPLQVVFGYQEGAGGTVRDPAIDTWLQRRYGRPLLGWVDLSPKDL